LQKKFPASKARTMGSAKPELRTDKKRKPEQKELGIGWLTGRLKEAARVTERGNGKGRKKGGGGGLQDRALKNSLCCQANVRQRQKKARGRRASLGIPKYGG